ncbi:immunity-related GTPase family Q protein [Heterocephalus glaber]|uniref:Immunity-related GTPase family Q protein n=1 Tax=Heterocephalus glaber TaxID=10181 RepID=A0AAX6QE05_HETGA|nr:immunity-related GTPase family Q protein [Heterocephalus glaber]XP_004873156.1 immunity-related GTPase family Q protein [Heterocephalus glaber]XP_004873157.1 immunity-related GTPase family Q protein [Heterocephalus glaber]
MPPPPGDVTALFLGPPGSGKSALIAALCDKDVETVEIPEGRLDSGIPSLRAAGPGLFLGELSCPPAAPGPWAAEANVLVLVLPGPEGNEEPFSPELGEAARAALARGTPLLAVRNLIPGDSQQEAQARDRTAALLDSSGLGAAALFVLPKDCSHSDDCEELERLRAALRSQAEALRRLLPPAQDGFEVLGAAELEAVREAFETGGLEAALSWVRAGLERLGSARLDLAVAGTTDVSLVLDTLLGLDPGDPGAIPASMPTGPTPWPAPECPNVVLWAVPLGSPGTSSGATPHPTHYDALILVTPGPPTEKDWAQVRALVSPDVPLVCVRTDCKGKDPEFLEEEEKVENPRGQSLGNTGEEGTLGKMLSEEERRGAGSQKAGSQSLLQVDGANTQGSGKSGRAAPLSPEDETWEVLEEALPPVFPLCPGGLPGLCEWLQRALPSAQAGALLLALPPASPSAARKKAAALRAGAWRPALLASLAAAAAPVPGLGWACDVALLRGQLAEWRRALGLEPAVLARRERALGLAPGELAARAHFPGPVTRAEVEARLGAWAGEGTAGGAALGALSFLWPAGGAAATGGLGYRAAHGVLLQALDEMRADAEAVLAPGEAAP